MLKEKKSKKIEHSEGKKCLIRDCQLLATLLFVCRRLQAISPHPDWERHIVSLQKLVIEE